MAGNPVADSRREEARRIASAEASRLAAESAAAKVASLNKIIADKGYQGAAIDYGTRTVGGRGADREVRDDTSVMGFTVPNPDGTYSRYDADGKFSHSFKPNSGGLLGGISSDLTNLSHSIADSPIAMAAITAAAAAYGVPPAVTAAALGANRAGKDGNIQAGLETGALSYAGGSATNGLLDSGLGIEGAGSGIAEQAASTGATAGGSGGLIGAESMAVPELAAPSYGLSGGAGTFGSASAGSTGAAMGGATGISVAPAAGANTLSGLLASKTGVLAAGGLLGALAGKDTQTTQSSSKDPWGPAQPYLLDNLKTNAAMQKYYQENPFSNEQKAAYQNVFNANANGMANAPVMSQIANNFMGSNRGRMAAMPSFIQGTQAAPVNWDAYKNIGLLKG